MILTSHQPSLSLASHARWATSGPGATGQPVCHLSSPQGQHGYSGHVVNLPKSSFVPLYCRQEGGHLQYFSNRRVSPSKALGFASAYMLHALGSLPHAKCIHLLLKPNTLGRKHPMYVFVGFQREDVSLQLGKRLCQKKGQPKK